MKTMKLLTVLVMSLMIFSCSKNDDTVVEDQQQEAGVPSDLNYSQAQIDVAFYTTGSTSIPSVNWNGEQGTFSLDSTIDGLTINSQSGVLSWNKNLPLGENYVTVKALNSKGWGNTHIILNNRFQGHFIGGYNNDPNSTVITTGGAKLTFNADGTMTCEISGTVGIGSWISISGEYISVTFQLSGSGVAYKYDAQVIYSESISPYAAGSYGIAGTGVWQGHMRVDKI
ncbi:hypothetical protein [Ulvibacter antarcticus]|uniref:Ig-like domain-containing protein n=1 Tax=Ulvibacter antarcticus TaxID=442714 RepID=A0A3L9Y8Z4_9FLAO|nr:hypothetical protein [Ulvibacter antarcticus]RMA57176.1 hypothetical protein BXY75_3063 [Ulvibacter antarcticus]